jgi:hypothetical protein
MCYNRLVKINFAEVILPLLQRESVDSVCTHICSDDHEQMQPPTSGRIFHIRAEIVLELRVHCLDVGLSRIKCIVESTAC